MAFAIYEELLKRIEEERTQEISNLGEGSVRTFEAYSERVGFIRGLAQAAQIIKDFAQEKRT